MTESAMRAIRSLDEVLSGYDALFCDVWGVVHDGVASHPAAVAALTAARRAGKKVVLLTNSPRLNDGVERQIAGLGVTREAFDAIVTSGDATRALIEAGSRHVLHIGPERDLDIFGGLGLSLESEAGAQVIVCTGLADDRSEDPETYRPLLERLADRGLPMICANPDIVVHVGDRLIPCAGAVAAIYAEIGGTVHLAGKPHAPIYAVARRAGGEEARVLCIGDGLMTDVLGANNHGADCLFISHGIHRDELADVIGDPVLLSAELLARGVGARYVMPALR
ncbi:TIGR01459 family HAD-type hydrolase [Aureimonas sp. AU22]|jgi:HAD superfamily hydrolase (TIGR01459 family)|uniref:TIGR01459 family HAD-type hydrolase n=1 Tax=Aureimonas sp. AU22 TaxID=1638162 RepID=UPI0009E67EB6|nr:TIGR01459 family HAD-type hydrolase [Aureimonas sp. AU22]